MRKLWRLRRRRSRTIRMRRYKILDVVRSFRERRGGPMSTPYDERTWFRFYPTGVPPGVEVPDVPLTHLLDDAARRFPHRRALVFLGRSVRYRRVVRDAGPISRGLGSPRGHKGG